MITETMQGLLSTEVYYKINDINNGDYSSNSFLTLQNNQMVLKLISVIGNYSLLYNESRKQLIIAWHLTFSGYCNDHINCSWASGHYYDVESYEDVERCFDKLIQYAA